MGVICFKTKLSKLKNDTNFRFDVKFGNFLELSEFHLWNCTNCCELKYALKPINSPIMKKGELEEEEYLIDLSNIERKRNNLINLEKTTKIGSDKNIIKYGDIVIPKIEPKKGQFFLNLNHKEYIGSTELVEYEINKNEFNPYFLYYTLTSEKFLKVLSFLESGKTHKRVSSENILKIKIPKISISIQNELAKTIQPIENEITHLKKSKLKPLDIINQIFGEAFEFDWQAFENIKKQKAYSSSLNEFSNNIDCRMGLKFHNLAGKYLHAFLSQKTTKKIKDFIIEPIILGKGVSPNDYDEDGEYYYIAMSNIKTYAFDPEDCKKVSDSYAQSNQNKRVKKDDILLARSGEGTIGKVALIEDEDLNAIFSDFTQRIRLTNYNIHFAYYYFRSEFFQYLVYTHKKGLGNNTNIFPSQIQEFPIPDWDNTKQTDIVEKIKTQIDAQNLIDQQIEQKQQQINSIIENAILTPKKYNA